MTPEEIGTLIVRLQGDGSSYQKMLQTAQVQTKQVAVEVEKSSNQIQSFGFGMRRFALSAIGALAPLVGGLSALGSAFQGVRLAADMEQMSIAFEVLVGDAGMAKKTLEDLRKFAAETPFEMPEIVSAAKQMLAFGETADNIVPTMKQLGDISSGLGIPLGQLTYLFGTLKSQGRAFTVDINQFAMRGIPIWAELEKQFGKTNQQVRQMVEKGQVGFADVEKAFANMTSAGGKFGGMMEKQSKSVTGLFSTMKDEVNNFLRILGENIIEVFRLKEAMQFIIDTVSKVVEWMRNLSPETKTVVAVIAALTTAVTVLTLAWPILTAVVGAFLATVDVLLGPVNILGIAIAGLAVLIVQEFGGIGAVWDRVKQAAIDAWEWIRPVRKALESFFRAVLDTAKMLWAEIKRIAIDVWTVIANTAQVDWELIRGYIVDAIIAAEFALRNFGQVAEFVWTSIKLQFVTLTNEIEYFFTTTVPILFDFFRTHWREIMTDFSNYTMTVMENLVSNLVLVIGNLPDLISGAVKFEDLWTPLLTGFEATLKELPELPARVLGDLESQLMDEFERQGDALSQSFEEFRRQKLAEFALPDEVASPAAEQAAAAAGKKLGSALGGGVAKELKKLEAVEIGSAEAISRIIAAREGRGDDTRREAVSTNSPDAIERQRQDNMNLKEIAMNTRQIAKKPTAEIDFAGIV